MRFLLLTLDSFIICVLKYLNLLTKEKKINKILQITNIQDKQYDLAIQTDLNLQDTSSNLCDGMLECEIMNVMKIYLIAICKQAFFSLCILFTQYPNKKKMCHVASFYERKTSA